MKLIPQSKPVRIRIKSGGKEHSSLSTLRDCFDIEDINSVCNSKSILRWLEQQNESNVLEKVKDVISLGSNDEALYDLKLILAFFPEAEKEGVNSISGILSFWANHGNYFNVEHYLNLVNDTELIEDIQNSPNEQLSKLVKERLGEIHFLYGRFNESAQCGNKEALKTIKLQLPAFTSNYSYEDVKSFIHLQELARIGKTIKPEDFPQPVKNVASLASLLQYMLTAHHNPSTMCINLRSSPLISKKNWPDNLQGYVCFMMRAIRKYIGASEVKNWARSIHALFDNGTYDFNGLSMANAALLEGDNEANQRMSGMKRDIRSSLTAVTKDNSESFRRAISMISDNLLGL